MMENLVPGKRRAALMLFEFESMVYGLHNANRRNNFKFWISQKRLALGSHLIPFQFNKENSRGSDSHLGRTYVY